MNPNSKADVIVQSDGVLRVQGDLNFTTVLGVRRTGEKLIANATGSIEVDFSGVHDSGSAAVSLIMCWLRAACRADKSICFTGLPDLLKRIIAVSGLSEHLVFDQPHHCQ